MQTTIDSGYSHLAGRNGTPPKKLTNRERIARYDRLIEEAEMRADAASTLDCRRHFLNLMLHLQSRALRELGRNH